MNADNTPKKSMFRNPNDVYHILFWSAEIAVLAGCIGSMLLNNADTTGPARYGLPVIVGIVAFLVSIVHFDERMWKQDGICFKTQVILQCGTPVWVWWKHDTHSSDNHLCRPIDIWITYMGLGLCARPIHYEQRLLSASGFCPDVAKAAFLEYLDQVAQCTDTNLNMVGSTHVPSPN